MADKEQQQQEHIPTQSKYEQQEEPSSGSGGLLSKLGDPAGTSHFPPSSSQSHTHTPLGKVLGTALRPIGAPLEKGLTGPLGSALGGTTRSALGPLMGTQEEKSELLGGDNKDSYSGPEKIGGKEQTGGNPLGLDQSGRWGFEGDK